MDILYGWIYNVKKGIKFANLDKMYRNGKR